MFESFRGHSMFEMHVGNNRRNAAALEKFFFRLGTGQSRFDSFNICGGNIVFLTQGDEGAAAVKNVANELEGGGADQDVWFDAQGDVVNGFAAVHCFGNPDLLRSPPAQFPWLY